MMKFLLKTLAYFKVANLVIFHNFLYSIKSLLFNLPFMQCFSTSEKVSKVKLLNKDLYLSYSHLVCTWIGIEVPLAIQFRASHSLSFLFQQISQHFAKFSLAEGSAIICVVGLQKLLCCLTLLGKFIHVIEDAIKFYVCLDSVYGCGQGSEECKEFQFHFVWNN